MMNVDEPEIKLKYMGNDYYQDSVVVVIKGSKIELSRILTILSIIDFSRNKFQGEILKSIGRLNSLWGLNLSHNNLEGLILTSPGNLTNLESLDLSSNELVGVIPQQLTSLMFLEVLNLSDNQLIGPIPHGSQFNKFGSDSYSGNLALCGFPLSKKCKQLQPLPPPPILQQDENSDNIRLLLRQGIPLHGHDEFEDSSNQGNFLELLMLLSDQNENLEAVLSKDVPEHLKLTAPSIQKDVVNAIAVETANAIVRELGDGMFSIVFDKSWDASMEEQSIVSLRYVDGRGYVIEHFLGLKQISSSSVLSLKEVEDLLSTHIEDISWLRGQSYDEVNNIDMQGEFTKFTTVIIEENESAYYVHYVAHKLELTLVEATKSHPYCNTLLHSF
ncbi:hypothetical protein ACSBR1_023058 [Camellia fascicularis]